jgi:hypothetical protein
MARLGSQRVMLKTAAMEACAIEAGYKISPQCWWAKKVEWGEPVSHTKHDSCKGIRETTPQ